MNKSGSEQRFLAELLDGHKGTAVIVPFDPAKVWKVKPVTVPAPWKSGYLVQGRMNDTPFEGWIGRRWGRWFILVDKTLKKQMGAKTGDVVSVAIAPRRAATRTG